MEVPGETARHGRPIVAALFLLLTTGVAAAGPLSEELQRALQNRPPEERVPVIITFADRVDPAQFRGLDRRARRSALTKALRAKAALTQAPVKALLAARGAKGLRELWLSNSLAAHLPASTIALLEKNPAIASIRRDEVVMAPAPAVVTGGPTEWNIAAVRAPDLWALGFTGTGTVVASMDTGVDAAHPELAPRWRGGSNSWYDPNGEHASPHDAHGHGTQTMGLMVAGAESGTAIGIAPDARWIAVKIFNDAGQASLSAIHLGFQWLLDPDGNPATDDAPDVVNNSWGLEVDDGTCVTEFDDDIRVLKTAGIGVMFAAGNRGSDDSPANNPAAFAVGAVDAALAIQGFSGRGPSACDDTYFPELTAPGVNVKTTDLSFGGLPLYAYGSGTSYAVPHVAGSYALLAQAFPSATVAELENALKAGARDLGPAGPDNDYGHGLVDVAAAYQLLALPVNQPPVAQPDSYSVVVGGLLTVPAPGLLANDSDSDGDPLSVVPGAASLPGLTLHPDGSFTYDTGSDPRITTVAFDYQASDGALSSAVTRVTLRVTPNNAPVTAPDRGTTPMNRALVLYVLENDHDPDTASDPENRIDPPSLRAMGRTTTRTRQGGTVQVDTNDGTVTFTPRADFKGNDTFTYSVKDTLGRRSKETMVEIAVE